MNVRATEARLPETRLVGADKSSVPMSAPDLCLDRYQKNLYVLRGRKVLQREGNGPSKRHACWRKRRGCDTFTFMSEFFSEIHS